MANRRVPGELFPQQPGIEYLAHQAHRCVAIELHTVADDHAGGLLAAVLLGK